MTAPAAVDDGSPQEPVSPSATQAGACPAEPVAPQTAPAEAGAAPATVMDPDPDPAEAEPAETEPADVWTPGPESAEGEVPEGDGSEAGVPEGEVQEAEVPEGEVPEAEIPEGEGSEGEGSEAAVAEVSDTERDMSPIAVIGVILCVIALVGVAAGVLAVLTHGFHKKTVVTYQHRAAAVFSLRPGECINTSAGGLAFTRLACSTSHDAEVFATFTLTGSSWPGTTAVQQGAGNGCADRLSGYLNPQLTTAALAQAYVYPDEAAWKADERTVICEVSSSTGKLTGSVRKPA
jgi:Septum formation